MSPPSATPRPLSTPLAGPAHYEHNFIQQAVCELRFPTLFDLEGTRPPAAFALALRREYPRYDAFRSVSVNAQDAEKSHAHQFKSKREHWTVTLRASAISLETSHYDSFEEFEKRLSFVLGAAEKVIDTDVLTRVGLRYINTVPFLQEEICEWVNPALVSVLGSGLYGDVTEHSQRVAGPTTCGHYLFQHGIAINESAQNKAYVLDLDFFCEDVAVSEAIPIVRSLHELEFGMFKWALGPRAVEHLGPSNLKQQQK